MNIANLQLLASELSSIERLQNRDIGFAKILPTSFRNLHDKLSMPAARDGFKPFKIIFFQKMSRKLQI